MSLSIFGAITLLLSAVSPVDAELIGRAVNLMLAGGDPHALEGVEPKGKDSETSLPDLEGCSASVSEDTGGQFVIIDFLCGEPEAPFVHRASFRQAKDAALNIYVDPLPTALGPTPDAIADPNLPKAQSQVKDLIKAVRKGGDASVGGLIPLNPDQIAELETLAKCRWDRPTKSMSSAPTWLAFITCKHHERGRGRMLEVQFDDAGHAIAVRLGYGSKVVRDVWR